MRYVKRNDFVLDKRWADTVAINLPQYEASARAEFPFLSEDAIHDLAISRIAATFFDKGREGSA
jgi:hypothetical protein